MDHKDIFLGRQPILDVKQNVAAYELLFRSTSGLAANAADVVDHSRATASVITNAICGYGIQDVLGKHTGFINVHTELLMSDMIELLPREQVVIELLETVNINDDVIERCRHLKRIGFRLALDDFTYDPVYEPLLDLADIIKIDLSLTNWHSVRTAVTYLRQRPLTLLAEKVETLEQFNKCKELGFDLFQGYYFAHPVILDRKKIDISKIALLKLLEQVLSDVETREIEETFKRSPTLSYNLLRLVNSVAMGMRHKIGTINHAIVVVGRQQLKRWVQLLLFTEGTTDTSSRPLMQMAATRGRLMELLVLSKDKNKKDHSDLAFMVGILSLLDVLIGMPMQKVVDQVSLHDEAREALLTRKGPLGKLLLLNEKLEKADFMVVRRLLREMNIDVDKLTTAQIEAMNWATGLSEAF